MKKVLITGANGFLGSALVNHLSRSGIEVIAVVRSEESDISKIKNIDTVSIVYCDLSEISLLKEKILDRDIDVFYYFAWDGTSGSKRGDYIVQLNNIKATCEAVYVCNEMKIERFVFAGSLMEEECKKLFEEKEPETSINNLYRTAKLGAHYMAHTIANSLNLSFIAVSISNIYGPGENSPRLVNSTIRKLLKGETPQFTAGTQMYDFIYIDDAVQAFTLVGEKGKKRRSYYLGSQNPHLLKEYLMEIGRVLAPKIRLEFGEIPFTDVSLNFEEIDIKQLNIDTGFIPQYTFASGVLKTAQWIRESEGL